VRSRLTVLPAVAFIVTLGLSLLSSPAAAATAPVGSAGQGLTDGSGDLSVTASCPANRVCLYSASNFGGQTFVIAPPGQDSTLHNNPCQGCISQDHPNSNNTWGDQMSSWVNNTAIAYCWSYNTNFGGTTRGMGGNGGNNPNVGQPDNDELSSIRPC
jgi:Peptidase inhibitor family I36